ncbi:unnamed protein product, partial [Choristocarpus tenellus]
MPPGWSGELQELQDETSRLLHNIRGGGSQKQALSPSCKAPTNHGNTLGEWRISRPGYRGASEPRKRRRRRFRPPLPPESPCGPHGSFDTSGWKSAHVYRRGMGVGKSTVEVLDKDESPRDLSPPISPPAKGKILEDGNRSGIALVCNNGGGRAPGHEPDLHHEEHARHLSFQDEEDRVRSLVDNYVPRCGDKLFELRAERERLAAIEETQRLMESAQHRQNFERCARRKWLAQDIAAAKVQRMYRGHIGRRRVQLMRETRKIFGEASDGWIEVRDRNEGELWYYNTSTGQSQWERPHSLLGHLAPPEKVKTLPSLSQLTTRSGGNQSTEEVAAPTTHVTTINPVPESNIYQSSANLPPLKGACQSLLAFPTAPKLETSGEQMADTTWNEDWPFLQQEELPDDRFEETGLGLVSNLDGNSDDEDDLSEIRSPKGFFLADGSPNIHLRETINQALQITKFDSVSTLLADYYSQGMQQSSFQPIPQRSTQSAATPCREKRDGRGNEGQSRVVAQSLEEDKNPPLFARCTGRRMVSKMSATRVRGRRARTAGAGERRTKGGSQQMCSKGSLDIKGLAIRDLTSPGFLPLDSVDETVAKSGASESARASNEGQGKEKSEGNKNGVGMASPESGVKKKEQKDICFNCWSKGSGKTCALHQTWVGSDQNGNQGAGNVRASESALMCKNWDIGVMRRRYRSEELQEVFMKEASSLHYDKKRKKFVAVIEQHHFIYRLLAQMIAKYNFTVRRKLHQRNWMRGFIRMGKVQGEDTRHTAKVLRLRNTMNNMAWVVQYSSTVRHLLPRPPITGTTAAECSGLVKIIVDRPSTVLGHSTRCIMDGPTSVPGNLYQPREYHLPPAITMPMPEPKYGDQLDLEGGNQIIPSGHPAAWIEVYCNTSAADALRASQNTVEVMSPVPGSDKITRTKYPPPLTVKFATFARKPSPGNLGIGGLAAEMTISVLVTTFVPPQYGNFTVIQKSSVTPTVSKEISAKYKSMELEIIHQEFIPRPLQHPLNDRKAPTVMMKTFIDTLERSYFGQNRPHQTGEEQSHGFRTSASADALPTLTTLDPMTFTPSEDIVSTNLCSANRTVTTHADRSYPFCEPSNRSNTTLDFYHLLLTATCSPNKEQVFTNLGIQECGEFMRGSDPLRPMGHCISVVYRSWAFIQKQILEEFETDDGVSYWFDRRTGETFWERPLCEDEKVPIKEGGTVLRGDGEGPDTSSGAFEQLEPRYDLRQMRRLMMQKHEDVEDLEGRRKKVASQVKWARQNGALPPPDPGNMEPTCGNQFEEEDSSISESVSSIHIMTSNGGREHGRGSDEPSSGGTSGRKSQSNSEISTQLLRRPGKGVREDTGNGSYILPQAEKIINSISQALATAGLGEGKAGPEDMLRLGMGLGITLNAKGLLDNFDQMQDLTKQSTTGDRGADDVHGDFTEVGKTSSVAPAVAKVSSGGHPIGHGHPNPVTAAEDSLKLDHASEVAYMAAIAKENAELKTSEEFKGLVIVPPVQPTACPDEVVGIGSSKSRDEEMDPRKKVVLATPIVAYPETLWKQTYQTHGAAGKGESWRPAGTSSTENQSSKSSLGAQLRRTKESLPEGFLNAISHTHIGKQHCDYLPHVPNLPQARPVGRVRPRSSADDWLAVGFDPWSAGREPLSAEFVPTLSINKEDLMENGTSSVLPPHASYIEDKDSAGLAELAVLSAEQVK